MAKILITGGAGFIGSNIAHYLVNEGKHEVIVLDDLSSGKKENLEPVISKIKFIEGDILDLDLLKKSFKGVDFVLHLAAFVSVPGSIEKPILSNDINVKGTLNVLTAAKETDVKRVVFSSSCALYGDSLMLPKTEKMVISPKSPYSAQKALCETYLKLFYELYGLETLSLRYFNVFGPRQDPDSQYAAAIPIFIKKLLNDEQPVIFGDGNQSRDFCFVEDVVRANILACEVKKTKGQIINIGSGEQTTILELVKNIAEILGKDIEPVFKEPREGDVLYSLADISKAELVLGFKSSVSFEEGLKKTIEWFKNN